MVNLEKQKQRQKRTFASVFYKEKKGKNEKSIFCYDICSERENRKFQKLEGLQTEGDTDDGDATQNAGSEITECHFPTEKDEPNDVHDGMLFKLHSDILAKRGEVH